MPGSGALNTVSRIMQMGHRPALRKVGHLVSGTIGSQLVIIATMPILTRLYSPEAFGAYGIFVAIVGVVSVFATFRFERGIVVARDIAEQHSTFVLTLAIALCSIPLSYGAFLLWGAYGGMSESPIQEVVNTVPALLAIAVGLHGIEMAYNHLALKRQAYGILGIAQTVRSVVQAGLQMALALSVKLSQIGLIIGAAVAPAFVALLLLVRQRQEQWTDFDQHPVTMQSIRDSASHNDIYPKYMVWSALFNSLTNHALVILIGALFSVGAAGSIFLAYRVLMMPTKLLARNISLVNLQEASELSGERMTRLYKRRVSRMLLLGAGPMVLTISIAPWLFTVVFGPEWHDAGITAQILAPAVYFQFVFMSFLTLFTALRAQKTYLGWSMGRLVMIVAGVYGGALIGGVHGAAAGFGLALGVSYLVAHLLLLNRLDAAGHEGKTS